MLRDTRLPSKQEYRAQYPDARPAFARDNGASEGCRAEARQCVGGPSPPNRELRLGEPFSPVEPGVPTEISPGRRCWRTAKCPDARFSALGSFSERSLKVRRLLREQEQTGAVPVALTISRDANTGAGQDPHRPDCGGSTPPSCRDWVASIAAMQRSLKPQSTGQHRGDPPL